MSSSEENTVTPSGSEAGDCDAKIDPDYLAGLIDGDHGGVYGAHSPTVHVTSCEPLILTRIHDQFGGTIRKHKKKDNHRLLYEYSINGQHALDLFKYVANNVIIENDKIDMYIRALEEDDHDQKLLLMERASKFDKLGNDNKPYHRLNYKYLAGIFDSGGSITAGRKVNSMSYRLSITQKDDPILLKKIEEFVGHGSSNTERYNLYDSLEIYKLLKEMEAYCVVKKRQIMWILESMDTKDNNKRDELIKMITDDKHQEVDIDVDKYKLRNVKKIKKVIPEHQKKILKERMTGALNPNFGKERSEEHCKNIALAQVLSEKNRARRSVTDVQIEEIKRRYANGETNKTQLAKDMNCNRDVISKVIEGKMKTLAEAEEELRTGVVKISKSIKDPPKEKPKTVDDSFRIRVIKYIAENGHLTFDDIEKQSEELFGQVVKKSSFRNWIYGRYVIKEDQFPIEGVEYSMYLGYLRK